MDPWLKPGRCLAQTIPGAFYTIKYNKKVDPWLPPDCVVACSSRSSSSSSSTTTTTTTRGGGDL